VAFRWRIRKRVVTVTHGWIAEAGAARTGGHGPAPSAPSLTSATVTSVIPVMTETTDPDGKLPPVVRQFVLHWGNLGERWGINRSVSQIHALLYVSERPLTAEDIAETLGLARSNVSTSLRELQAWEIVRPVSILADRRTFYEAETDLWTIVNRIASVRKSRELDPAASALRQCIERARGDRTVSPVVEERLNAMLEFTDRTSRWFDQMSKLSRGQISLILKLGGGIVKLLERKGA
jgi:DNA-binding transcriptional regulator GbsR (MarR family)